MLLNKHYTGGKRGKKMVAGPVLHAGNERLKTPGWPIDLKKELLIKKVLEKDATKEVLASTHGKATSHKLFYFAKRK